jgi:tetratricopeptide (TPR) repeat protein
VPFFVYQEEQVPGTWTIHPLMREGLEEHQDAELLGEVHQYLFDHYNRQLQGLESTAISDPHKTALTEAFHHGKHVLATEEFFEWFTTIEEIFERAALWQFLTPLYEEFARLMEDRLSPEHPDTGVSLNNLAGLYYSQGRYEEAASLYERALAIWEKALGPKHPHTAFILNNLAVLCDEQGRYDEAERLYQRALRIQEKILGRDHPATTRTREALEDVQEKRRGN